MSCGRLGFAFTSLHIPLPAATSAPAARFLQQHRRVSIRGRADDRKEELGEMRVRVVTRRNKGLTQQRAATRADLVSEFSPTALRH